MELGKEVVIKMLSMKTEKNLKTIYKSNLNGKLFILRKVFKD